MVYTPKKTNWLNMAEIEFSDLSKQCLDRRIGELNALAKEVYAWCEDRNRLNITVTWQFSKNNARDKFNRHYKNVRN